MAHETRRGRQRAHTPHELGPRLFKRGAWWVADFRAWGEGRVTLRDPSAPTWPVGGVRTKSRREAERWTFDYVEHFEDVERRHRLGLPPAHRTLKDATADFLRYREGVVEPNTLASDRTATKHLLDFFGEDAPVDVLTSEQVQRLLDDRLAAGYEPTTLQTYCHSLNRLALWLNLQSLWDGRGLYLPKPGRHDARTWEPEEITKLREAADWLDERRREGPSFRLVVELALATGARQSELFGIQWPDFDAEARTVRLDRQVARGGGRLVPLKGKEPRTAVVLPDWWTWHEHSARGLGLVLAGRDGAPYEHRAHRRFIERVLDAARLTEHRVAWHAFRHTYSRRFIEQGGRLEELQKSLGHSSISTTERTYGHFREDVAARAAVGRIYTGQGLRVVK